MCAAVLTIGVKTTSDLEWPSDQDLFRDIAQAQTIADGSFSADPFYLDEKVWHNPLIPSVVAGSSKALTLSVHTTFVRLGPYLNLLGPLAFFVWVSRFAGVLGAATATFGFVFFKERWAPEWVTAAYSPWLFAMTSSQVFLYSGLVAYRTALVGKEMSSYVLAGVLLGLTFLAAAPPALLLGGTVLIGCFWKTITEGRANQSPGARRVLLWHSVLVAVALAVASPFLYWILVHYQLRVLNRVPMKWEWAGMKTVLTSFDLAWPKVLAVVGALTVYWRRRERYTDAVLLGSIAVVATVLLGYRWAFARLGLALPQFVPSHYFIFYWQALKWQFVGVAVERLWELLPKGFIARTAGAPLRLASLVATVGVAGGLAFVVGPYAARGYFTGARDESLAEGARPHLAKAFAWIRANTSPVDVFLASPEAALRLVGPAGRKAVVVGSVFSNPYVDWAERARASELMWGALRTGNAADFWRMARAFHVTFVLVSRVSQPWLREEDTPPDIPGIRAVFRAGGLAIWSVNR
jgi:hypothetical protein